MQLSADRLLLLSLLQLQRLLPTASFVAIDEEMTGIHLITAGGEKLEKMDDTTEQRYAKMRLVAQHYKLIQIGLCLFHELPPQPDADGYAPPRFEARPYNFYVSTQRVPACRSAIGARRSSDALLCCVC